MDDANVPSLLSLPLLGFVAVDDPVYQRTRRRILSKDLNPWYFEGSQISGVGSVHNGADRVWPMSLMVQYLTSTDDLEKRSLMSSLKSASADLGLFSESVNANNLDSFTRADFGLANALFVQLYQYILISLYFQHQ